MLGYLLLASIVVFLVSLISYIAYLADNKKAPLVFKILLPVSSFMSFVLTYLIMSE